MGCGIEGGLDERVLEPSPGKEAKTSLVSLLLSLPPSPKKHGESVVCLDIKSHGSPTIHPGQEGVVES